MSDTFSLLHIDHGWPVGVGATLLFALFLWKDWSLPRGRFLLHAAIALITVIALAMLVLKPMAVDNGPEKRGVLLTENYDETQFDSLRKEYPRIQRIPYMENVPIGEALDSVTSLFILGNGLQPYDFWQLKHIPTAYIPTATPKGVVQLNYKREPSIGDNWNVRGRYNSYTRGHTLQLIDPGGQAIDSIVLDTLGPSDFELRAHLKFTGRSLFHLLEKDTAGTEISKDPLPLKITPKKKLRVLMVQGFPTFDSKYLKNFLAETGNELVVRNQLSRGKYKFEYFNTARFPFHSISEQLLADMDILLIDANSYAKLPKRSLRTIADAIRHDGLGLLILPDEDLFKLPSKMTNFEFVAEHTPQVKMDNWPKLLLEKYPFGFQAHIGLEEIYRSAGLTWAAYTRRGKGRVGTTVVRNSFQWVLNGNAEAYHEFWTRMISRIGKRSEIRTTVQPTGFLAYPDEPFPFVVRTTEENPKVFGENGRIPLRREIDIQELYKGTTYPRSTGWSTLYPENDSLPILDYYVLDNSHWKSLKAFGTINENQRQFSRSTTSRDTNKVLRPIRPFWFFVMALLGMGFLWLAPKLFPH